MPIYEYQCTSCHHTFDFMQKINDEPIKQCPKCFENKVIKLISPAGFQLKGTGWYATDFKNKNNPVKESSESNKQESTKGTTDTVTKDSSASNTSDSNKSTKGDS